MMTPRSLLLGLAGLALGCQSTAGDAVDLDALGHQSCTEQIACQPDGYCQPTCGAGRHCLIPAGASTGTCWADCRFDKDCGLLGPEQICDVLGRCVPATEPRGCMAHRDCDAGLFCDPGTKTCVPQGGWDKCTAESDPDGLRIADSCAEGLFCNPNVRGGHCAPYCRTEEDCTQYSAEIENREPITCTPFGQCLELGYRDWVAEGEQLRCVREGIEEERLQRVRVDRLQDFLDGPCVYKGWNWACGDDGFCVQTGEAVDLGARDPAHPGDDLVGIWGLYFQVATITHNLPIVGTQPTYSCNWVLARVTQSGAKLKISMKLCDIDLVNFDPPTEMAWMDFPSTYMPSLPIVHQTVPLGGCAAGSQFDTDPILGIRGAILVDELTDPLPRYTDVDSPAWSAIWDQDADSHPGITVLMDGMLRAEIYNSQRWGDVKHARIYGRDTIGGLMTAHSEQYMVGASSDQVLYDSEVLMHEDAERTYFRMARMADLASCDDVLKRKATPGDWLAHTDRFGDVSPP